MSKHTYLWTAILIFLIFSCKNKQLKESGEELSELPKKSITSYVDPFIGTGGHGHTFPGVQVPFGMVQPSPDNGRGGWDWCSGYNISDSIITGFSQLHLSGTGIGDFADDVLMMPTNEKVDLTLFGKSRDSLPYTSTFSHKDEKATPGYYSVKLQKPKVKVELTASEYVAYHKYNFTSPQDPSFIIDLGFHVNWDKPLNTSLKLLNDSTIIGHRFSTGWAKNQKTFFVIQSSLPIDNAILESEGIVSKKDSVQGIKTGGQFFFKDKKATSIVLKTALSSVSIKNAIANLKAGDIGGNFNQVSTKTREVWNNNLSRIKVETPVDSLKTMFYTSLYHAQLAPVLFSDSDGSFRLQNDEIVTKNYKSYSTLSSWDIFRTQTSLLDILHPELMNDIIQSMLVYYDQQGSLPVWTLYGNETNTMTGYHSISIIGEAFVKGIRNYDVEKAYEAAKKTMMGKDRGLEDYKKYGYIPYDKKDESVTITLEYAYNDWCIAQMAKALNKEKDYQYFLNRSKAYQYLFDSSTGFMRAKASDGKKWRTPFDPFFSSHREHADYTEGNAWQHTWFVPQDVPGLIKLQGGKKSFVKRLEMLFTADSKITGENVSPDITGLIGQYAHGNEPSHHIVYLFNKAGAPWKTQYWARKILHTQYSTLPDGLSGNEDCGQMSAWYVMSAMGIFPMNPASGQYELGSPIFKKTVIQLAKDKTFSIIAPKTSDRNIYVQSIKLNGQPLNRTYITHKELMAGGKLEFEMGSLPKK